MCNQIIYILQSSDQSTSFNITLPINIFTQFSKEYKSNIKLFNSNFRKSHAPKTENCKT